jgi:hypothetical protein
MTDYITQAFIEREGQEIEVDIHFRAAHDEGAVLVDAPSIAAYRNDQPVPLRKVEQLALAVMLEREPRC